MQINAIPYNDFFWDFNDEHGVQDSTMANMLFFADSNSITNKTAFRDFANYDHGLFEHPYVHWSTDRVSLVSILSEEDMKSAGAVAGKDYELSVRIFMDMNQYQDSLHVFTSTVLDPFSTYFHLPVDPPARWFINSYFDLCEIERRKFEQRVRSGKLTVEEVQKLYLEMLESVDHVTQSFILDVDLGHRKKQVLKWNEIIRENVGVDNVALFDPFDDKKK